MQGHDRAVTALSLDSSGSRLISGGYDYHIQFWDFNGMDRSLQSFRQIEPFEGYQLNDVHFNASGELFVVASGANRAKLYNRDGFLQHEYEKGDPYLLDMKNTRGHIAPLSCAQWHPTEHRTFLTAAGDSTIRLWDCEDARHQKCCIIAKAQRQSRLHITTACFNPTGKLVAAAREDGGISLWNYASSPLRPTMHVPDAHQKGTETSRMVFTSDDVSLFTRGGDDTLKSWDMRMFTRPVHVVSQLATFFPETDVILSPKESLVITGTSVKKGQIEQQGQIKCYDRYTMELKHSIDVGYASAIRLRWHSRLNQIFVGCSDGSILGLYDPEQSQKGLLLSMGRKAKRKLQQQYTSIPEEAIYLPNAAIEEQEEEDERIRIRRDQFGSRAAEVAYNLNMPRGESELLKKAMAQSTMHKREEDPREALLKYAKEAEERPRFIGHVYKQTQPKPIFDMSEVGQEGNGSKKSKK